jgi:homoserine/homoserine lactone efflux protein
VSTKFILIYCVTVFIASITPGPSMLLALNHGIRYGVRRTIASALGNNVATFAQALLTIAGLGTVLLHSQTTFSVIKLCGAAYLIFLGITMFFSHDTAMVKQSVYPVKSKTPIDLFAEGFVVTMANPKAILFFTALFPQFISRRQESAWEFFTIVSVLLATTFGCMMIYSLLGLKISGLLKYLKWRKAFNRVVGTTFVAMGIGLATAKD